MNSSNVVDEDDNLDDQHGEKTDNIEGVIVAIEGGHKKQKKQDPPP